MATAFLIMDDEETISDESELRLDPGQSLRTAQWADLEPVAQLILDVCTNDGDPTIAVPPGELRAEWELPGFVDELCTAAHSPYCS